MLRRKNPSTSSGRGLALTGSVLMFAAGAVIVVLAVFGPGRSSARKLPDTSFAVATSTPTQTPVPEATPVPTPPPSTAPIARLQIPRIGVDAPVIVLGVDRDGVMESPSKPMDVAWYDFSSRPGFQGNAVFAGHVDYAGYGPAVFWRLRDVQAEDEVRVLLSDGTSYTYRVISATSYAADSAPLEEIVGPTPNEVITLITCVGTFDTRTREYDRRLVVRAERVPAKPEPQAGTAR